MSWPGEGFSVPKLETAVCVCDEESSSEHFAGEGFSVPKLETAVCVCDEESSSEHFAGEGFSVPENGVSCLCV